MQISSPQLGILLTSSLIWYNHLVSSSTVARVCPLSDVRAILLVTSPVTPYNVHWFQHTLEELILWAYCVVCHNALWVWCEV